MKLLKWLLAIVVSLVVAVTLYLTVFFDPNTLKAEIINGVKQQTGRDLVISNQLSWTFLPVLGIQLNGVTLSNPAGLTPQPMLDIKVAMLEVALRPLLSQKIEVVRLSLDGVVMHLVTGKDGRSSFDGLIAQDVKTKAKVNGTTAPAAEPKEGVKGPELARIDIQDISITNVQIHRQDALLGQSQTLALERFTLHGFSLGTFASFTFKGQYLTSDMNLRSVGAGELNVSRDLALVVVDNLTMTTAVAADILQANPLTSVIKLTSQIALDKKQLSAEISQLSVGDLQAAGTLTLNYAPPVPKFTVVMQTDELLLDKLLPSAASAEEGASTELSGPAPKEPDLSGLARFDLQLTLAATAVKYAKLAMQNLQLQLNVEHGVLDISSLTADLYQGRLLAKARVDGRRSPATYQFDKQITDVQLHPLLKDAADVDGLAGTATFHLKGSGSSLVMQHVKPHLVANGQLEIRDGVLYGVDLAHMLRQAYATVTGAAPAPKGQAKTDFSRLSGTFFLDNGILTNPDLVVVSPLIQLTGKGTANILNDKLDYKLAASLINVLNNQSAAQPKPAGVTIPLMITGTLQHPEYKLDTKVLFNQQLQQETNKVKDKLKDSLLKKLGGF